MGKITGLHLEVWRLDGHQTRKPRGLGHMNHVTRIWAHLYFTLICTHMWVQRLLSGGSRDCGATSQDEVVPRSLTSSISSSLLFQPSPPRCSVCRTVLGHLCPRASHLCPCLEGVSRGTGSPGQGPIWSLVSGRAGPVNHIPSRRFQRAQH